MYRKLDPDKIVETLGLLRQRIEERFPGAGLGAVCSELSDIAGESRSRAAEIAAPNRVLRLVIGFLIGGCLLLLVYVGQIIDFKRTEDNFFGVLQGIDAFFNIVIVMGATGLFLITIEERVKRRRVLKDLHQLRSIVHVIDMHQLTKDPSVLLSGGLATQSSPKRTMSEFELMRYLDYCSEMLSLAGKTSALYTQHFRDPVVIAAVNELEQLTTNLSHKIWQKIMVLQRYEAAPIEAAYGKPAGR